ncbi:hypothetical protein HS088_TW16G00167 [Tripterygium wilfordii]|uniref:Uncharacterized protein n=1 Tax=Tripterygium wilfordii TaxID=458696 RepID=A0A7J7CI57_TRIWF|nr:hypothetical protein HS088_TW16G00167 [Tripterygium wilfordii]
MKMETLTLVSLVLLPLLLCSSLSSANLIDDLQLARPNFPKVKAEKMIRELNLSPKEDVNVIEGRDSVEEPRIVERRFRFPNLTESAVSVEDLGHHAGYYKVAHSHDARYAINTRIVYVFAFCFRVLYSRLA